MYQLNAAFAYVAQPPNKLLVTGPTGEFVIIDRSGLIGAVLGAIAQGAPIDPVFAGIADTAQQATAKDRILSILTERGLISEAETLAQQSHDVYCDWLGFIGPEKLPAKIDLVGTGLLVEQIYAELSALGIGVSRHTTMPKSGSNVAVFCQDKPDRAALRAANKQAVETGTCFFPVALNRHIVTLGPFIVPRATACMECLHHREAANRTTPDAEIGKHITNPPSQFAARYGALIGVQTLLRHLYGAAQDMHMASVTRHSVITGKSAASTVLKLPRCPVCAGPALAKPLISAFAAPPPQPAALAAE